MSVSVTVAGNVVDDPTRRTTTSGKHLATFRVAHNVRTWDSRTRTWFERDAEFYSVSCWDTLAENVADSLRKGMPVLVVGRLKHYTQERVVGDQTLKVQRVEIVAEAVGPDLSRGVAQFRRTKSQAVRRAEERAIADATAGVAGETANVGGPTAGPPPAGSGPNGVVSGAGTAGANGW